jgi:hypothetical protein
MIKLATSNVVVAWSRNLASSLEHVRNVISVNSRNHVSSPSTVRTINPSNGPSMNLTLLMRLSLSLIARRQSLKKLFTTSKRSTLNLMTRMNVITAKPRKTVLRRDHVMNVISARSRNHASSLSLVSLVQLAKPRKTVLRRDHVMNVISARSRNHASSLSLVRRDVRKRRKIHVTRRNQIWAWLLVVSRVSSWPTVKSL